jgi:fructose-1,6-bisphosphatase
MHNLVNSIVVKSHNLKDIDKLEKFTSIIVHLMENREVTNLRLISRIFDKCPTPEEAVDCVLECITEKRGES